MDYKKYPIAISVPAYKQVMIEGPSLTGYVPHLPLPPPLKQSLKPEAVAAPEDPKLKKAADSGTESESEDEEKKAKAKRVKHYLKAAKKDSLAEAKERMRKFARLASKDKHSDEAQEIAEEYMNASPHDMEMLSSAFEIELNKELNKRPAPEGDAGDFDWFTHHGTDYKMNKRGDVVTPDMEWVGRWNGVSINENVRMPADLKGKVTEL